MSKEIAWYGPAYDPSGYASACRSYIYALHKLGVKVKLEPVTYWSPIRGGLTEEQEEFLRALEHTPISKHSTKVQHTIPSCYHRDREFDIRRMNIGYTVFETSGLPPEWLPQMEMMDKLFVPSSFNLKTFQDGGVDPKKLVSIPHIVDTEKMNPELYEPMPIPIEKEFYFLTIMDFTKRKGWDILLKAYLREFRGNRDVGLIFKAYFDGVSDQHQQNLINRIRSFKESLNIKNAPDIIFYGDVLDEFNLYRLYKSAHAYVLPVRGGGWELSASESMAMEVPVIITNWSGQLEYCNPGNSYLIDVLNFEETDEEMIKISPHYKGQKWANPSEVHLRQLMRHVYEHYSEAKEKAKLGRRYLRQHFNWKVIGNKIIDNII